MRGSTVTSQALVLGFLAVASGVERAQAEEAEEYGVPAHIQNLSDGEVTRRLNFLVDRLDTDRDYAWWWWHGWTAFYGVGVVVEGVRAGLTDHDAKKAEYIIGGIKAAGGFILLLMRPQEAMNGADAVRALPGTTAADRRLQLAVAEDQLRRNAEVSLRRYNWLRHLLNFGINAAGGVIIGAAFDDPSRGARSAGVGTAVGEISLWSQPWWPADDWEAYRRRFNAVDDQRLSWRFVPTIGGVAVQINF